MPQTPVTSPSGEVIYVTHPEGASTEQIIEYAKSGQSPQETPSSMDDFSAMDRFIYEFRTTPSMTQNIAILAEAVLPMGYFGDPLEQGSGFYTSPSEAYGEDYDDLSVDERRQRILEFQQAYKEKKYPRLSRLEAEGADMGKAGMAGEVLSGVADVSSLAPVGKGLAKVAAISGLLGGSYEATRGLAQEGKIDGAMTALATVGGAAFGAAADKSLRAIAPQYNKLKAALGQRRDLKEVTKANAKMEQLNSKIIEIVASEENIENPLIAAAARLKMKPQEALQVINKATETFDIPDVEIARASEEFRKTLEKGLVPSGFVADLLGTVSTQVKKISPTAHQALRDFEFRKTARIGNYLEQVRGFEKIEKELPQTARETFALYLNNQNYTGARKLLKDYGVNKVKTGMMKYRDTNEIMDSVQQVLKDIYDSRANVDGGAGYLEDFFPRQVKDLEGLRSALGMSKRDSDKIEKMLNLKAEQLKKTVDELTDNQRSAVFDDYLKGERYSSAKSIPAQFKHRQIRELNSDLNQFYDSPAQALTSYIARVTDDTEMRRFFSTRLAQKSDEPELNIDDSIGAYARALYDDGEINDVGMDELRKYLDARFSVGTQSPHRAISALKNISNAILLGNPISATTQLGDLFVAAHRYGVKNTFGSVIKGITGRGDINVETLGLQRTIAEDLSDTGSTAKFLDAALSLSGFRFVDRVGKNTALEAAFKMNKNLAKSSKGVAKLREKWGDIYGSEFDSLVADLQGGTVSDNVKLLMWHELSGHQPISLSEMPLKYLQNPNGRVFYALKSFTIKQLDMLRNSVGEQYNKGNYKEAGKQALSYLTLVSLGGATVQELRNAEQGRGFDLERIDDNFVDQVLMTAFMSRYVIDNKLRDGDIFGALLDVSLPPTGALENLTKDAKNVLSSLFTDEEISSKSARSVPLIGRAYYNLLGGGAEEFLEREKNR